MPLGASRLTSLAGYQAPAGATDPYWTSVELLIPGGQTNASTTIVDASANNRTAQYNSGVSYSTTQTKWSTTSLYFNGSNYIGYEYSSDLQPAGDFTWEAWIYPTTYSGYPTFVGYGANGILLFYHHTGLNGIVVEMDKDGSGLDVNSNSGVAYSLNQWQHIAITRSGTSVKYFKDGTQIGTATLSGSPTLTRRLAISSYVYPGTGGGSSPGNYFTGYMEDIRFTNGVARYTASFTPPSEAFPTA